MRRSPPWPSVHTPALLLSAGLPFLASQRDYRPGLNKVGVGTTELAQAPVSGVAAAEAVAESVVRAVRLAPSLGGLPGLAGEGLLAGSGSRYPDAGRPQPGPQNG